MRFDGNSVGPFFTPISSVHMSVTLRREPTTTDGVDVWPPWETYAIYGAAREEADAALEAWCAAPSGAKRVAYAAYRAAADREDSAVSAWLRSCVSYDAAGG